MVSVSVEGWWFHQHDYSHGASWCYIHVYSPMIMRIITQHIVEPWQAVFFFFLSVHNKNHKKTHTPLDPFGDMSQVCLYVPMWWPQGPKSAKRFGGIQKIDGHGGDFWWFLLIWALRTWWLFMLFCVHLMWCPNCWPLFAIVTREAEKTEQSSKPETEELKSGWRSFHQRKVGGVKHVFFEFPAFLAWFSKDFDNTIFWNGKLQTTRSCWRFRQVLSLLHHRVRARWVTIFSDYFFQHKCYLFCMTPIAVFVLLLFILKLFLYELLRVSTQQSTSQQELLIVFQNWTIFFQRWIHLYRTPLKIRSHTTFLWVVSYNHWLSICDFGHLGNPGRYGSRSWAKPVVLRGIWWYKVHV